ncbi:MAG TPA: protease complex subunit PrcB family protein [Polyangiales bacterium]|nr:protease complex subunit PrcB family protein [Polyangiales bacterium]
MLAGCAGPDPDDPVELSSAELQARGAIAFEAFEDPSGVGQGQQERRRVIRSARQYERLLGHAPPADAGFDDGAIVVLYDAGVKRTGGYTASIQSIEATRSTLIVTTRLESPGQNCAVTDALTHPYALVKLERPRGVNRVRFERDDVVRDCEAPRTCEDVKCEDGSHCELTPVWCIRAPCPELPSCVPDEEPVQCGGFAGTPCPGLGMCVDDASDDCDPENGGADCGGLCECNLRALCIQGLVFDSSPSVCACVPDPAQDPCAAVRCRAGTHCESDGQTASCVPDAPFCGGIGGIPCPGAGMCVDNPSDDCDPKNGGADCGGVCECNALGKCMAGMIWDDSPRVCGCVPEVNPCAATLCPTGTTCEVIDGDPVCLSNGSLACGKNTCAKGTTCCNASCGVCTPPGTFCTQQACLDE